MCGVKWLAKHFMQTNTYAARHNYCRYKNTITGNQKTKNRSLFHRCIIDALYYLNYSHLKKFN